MLAFRDELAVALGCGFHETTTGDASDSSEADTDTVAGSTAVSLNASFHPLSID